jgi:hypothetical protein
MFAHHPVRNFLFYICLILFLVSCGTPATPPITGPISLEPNQNTIQVRSTASLSLNVQGSNIHFKWSASRGSLSAADMPSVIYTAPNTPGPDVVTVEVSGDGGSSVQSITLTIVEPPTAPPPTATETPLPTSTSIPTETPRPTDTPIPTATPEPLSCTNALVTKYVFPLLLPVDSQFPFYGPQEEPNFHCEGDYGLARSEPVAVKLEYTSVGKNFGFFGIGTPKGFDASVYGEICFWAYSMKPAQNFFLQVRDTTDVEKKLRISLEPAGEWTQFCTPLSKFADMGVKLNKIENFNLGFNADSGSAAIWVDDFELK